jgi:hypothetical protein
MRLYVLFGQRKEDYDGQYGPEALVCWDEFCVDENPDGFDEACEEYLAEHGDEFVATRVILIDIDGDKVRDCLVGVPTIKGKIQ